jgi:hypothetical protein
MTSNEVLSITGIGAKTNTYGCLDPIEIGPLEALLDDVRRTYAHIMWLEKYIAALPEEYVFSDMATEMIEEQERTRVGKPTVVGSVRWQMEINRKKQTAAKRTKQQTHPAIKLLLEERHHLVEVTTKAIAVGIKLDQIDYSRKQADLIVAAMGQFALTSGIDPTSPEIAKRIADALSHVMVQAEQQA